MNTSLPASDLAISELRQILPLTLHDCVDGDVYQEFDERGWHRLVHQGGAISDWASYAFIATLHLGEGLTRRIYMGTTEYHRGHLPAIAVIRCYKDHEDQGLSAAA